MQRFSGTFEELVAKLRAEVALSTNGQSLHLVGDGLLVYNDNLFGDGGHGWSVWFDRAKWAFCYEKKPKSELGCMGVNWGYMEGTHAMILGEILAKVKERWLKPIPRGKWYQRRKQYAWIYREDSWETIDSEHKGG
ncbi:MAG: hypothetical protein US42_C0008G0032 [Candidatus Magasanikbacteria bacterium GW2011_GWC2_37_14]|uniref:Uncharacterized protein n=1 Tax=Candidatus Magasanikbacteria bacterium GW2011_GWC2_37_14 TaxID=1619046 RepID=A0A0G0JHC5_9BACT|nr:MAG: hypothetical protein US42_C0008G0032 [Candidatus Magasanikbacteria bacterium GW2011_GWC2_37_14]